MLPFRILTQVLLALVARAVASYVPPRNYSAKNYYIVELDTSISGSQLGNFRASHPYLEYEHQINGLDDHFVFSIDKTHEYSEYLGSHNANGHHQQLKRAVGFELIHDRLVGDIRALHVLEPRKLEKRLPVPVTEDYAPRAFIPVDSSQQPIKDASDKLGINDPVFPDQWHLINTQYPGNDVNVTGLWYEGRTGSGIVTAIIDDGLDWDNPDLQNNFNAKGSWDYNDNTNLPKPRLFDDYHGTRCAGEIAAVKNDVCGVGVAYTSQVSGIRILLGAITAAEEAAAMIYGLDVNDIYLCLWGPTDDGKTLSQPDLVVKQAMIKGVQTGRKDKGAIYVFASGNGGRFEDLCNFDGYTNSIYSITVGAIDYKGLHPSYAEACSAVMVVTYSSGSGEHIHSTDIKNKCLATHGGTSAAAPLAAGMYALALEANPDLTWRDLQYVSALSTIPVNEDDGHYQKTAMERLYSHKYGYGKIDAYRMAEFAREWKNVNKQAWFYADTVTVDERISNDLADEKKVLKLTVKVTQDDLHAVNFKRVEHVTVTVNIGLTYRGKVGIRLRLPFGVVSDLATFRPRDLAGGGLKNWTFMLVAHWGENGLGDWVLEVFGDKNALDEHSTQNEIHFQDWQLRFFGEGIDDSKAEVYDVTKDYARERREKQAQEPATTSITTSEAPKTTSEAAPVSSAVAVTSVGSSLPTDTEKVDPPVDEEPSGSDDADDDDADGQKHYANDHTGQYFMAVAVVGFVVVVVLMRYHKTPGSSARRRRRDEYEFDIIPGEDYSDSDDDGRDNDLLDLGRRNDRPKNKRLGRTSEEERERLFDQLNAETLPDYDDEMFRIVDDDDAGESGGKSRKSGKEGAKEGAKESGSQEPGSQATETSPLATETGSLKESGPLNLDSGPLTTDSGPKTPITPPDVL